MKKENDRRPRRKAQGWLRSKGIKNRDIQRALGHTTQAQVSQTLTGRRNNREVLAYLLSIGCPAAYLDLPDDMKGGQP